MGPPPLEYRNAVPDLSSSSPLHNLTALSSSPPISPQSPTPQSRGVSTRRLDSPTTSNPHPFIGSAKAGIHSHPSFGRDQLRLKHLRASPEKAAAAGQKSWVLTAGPSTSPESHFNSLAVAANDRQGKLIEDALEQHFFDSSDDNPSSDWNDAMDHSSSISIAATSIYNAASQIASASSHIGLGIDSMPAADSKSSRNSKYGLGAATFLDNASTLTIPRKAKVRTFSRTQSSSQDPFSAGAGSSYTSGEIGGVEEDQPSRSQRQSQRRRLIGTSPKKLTRSRFDKYSSEKSSDEEGLPVWEQMQSKAAIGVNWSSVVEQVYEKVDGAIDLTRRNLTRIDPVIADLSKFVSIPHLRRDSSNTNASPSFSRTSSNSGNFFERTQSSTSVYGSPNSRRKITQGNNDSTFSSGLRIFLASNRLEIFPSAFFELQNLVVLTIRDNGLQELPPAIGQLVNLKELNVSQNQLRYLPAEIQKLHLDSFNYFPNPFDQPDDKAIVSIRLTHQSEAIQNSKEILSLVDTSMGPPAIPARISNYSRLAPLPNFAMVELEGGSSATQQERPESVSRTSIARCLSDDYRLNPKLPSLMEMCIRVLLEPEQEQGEGEGEGEKESQGNEDVKILLENYESGSLVNLDKSLSATVIRSLEAARRSAVKSWGRIRPQSKEEGTWCSGVEAKDLSMRVFAKRRRASTAEMTAGDFGEASNEESAEEEGDKTLTSTISIEEQLDRGDDARCNPWFNRCPNPSHYSRLSEMNIYSDNRRKRIMSVNFDWPGKANGGRLFDKASVERLEWVSHIAGVAISQVRLDEVAAIQDTDHPMLAKGCNLIPLQWRGCGPSCLYFLESPNVAIE